MIMIVMITVMTGIPEAISKEREMGTFDGMLSAPMNQISIILGYTASLCVKGFSQVILGISNSHHILWRYYSRKYSTGILPLVIRYF